MHCCRDMLRRVPTNPAGFGSVVIGGTAVAGETVQTHLASPLNPVVGPEGTVTGRFPLQVSIGLGSGRTAYGMDRQAPTRDFTPLSKQSTTIAAAPRESDVLIAAHEAFKRADVIGIRMGYVFKDGLITKDRAIVITVTEKKSIAALQEAAVDPLPSTFQGFPVGHRRHCRRLVAAQHGPAGQELFARLPLIAEEITYTPPDGVKLEKVTAKMQVDGSCQSRHRMANLKSLY